MANTNKKAAGAAKKNETEKIANAIKKALDAMKDYMEKSGRAKGKIRRERVDSALTSVMANVIPLRITDPKRLNPSALYADRQLADDLDGLLIGLAGKVWTGGFKDEAKKKPELKSPTCSPDYKRGILANALIRYLQEYKPVTPQLMHKPDAKRFLTLLSQLFPNVKNTAVCANAWRTFIENVHNACGTEGAEFLQRALWLYSFISGGVGKTFVLDQLEAALKQMGVLVGRECFAGKGQYSDPCLGMRTVTISDETPHLDSEIAPLLNPLIDREEFGFNIKFGACGMMQSFTNVVFASNFEPPIHNPRRYMVVPYLATNLEHLAEEDRMRYFPLWGKEKVAEAAIVELFTVAPFRAEHPDWTVSFKDEAPGRQRLISVPESFADILADIKATCEHIADTSTDGGSSIKMRPSAFVKPLCAVCGHQEGQEKKNVKQQLISLLMLLQSRNQLGYRGADNVFYALIDWHVFDNIIAGVETSGNAETDPLAATAAQWRELIDAE